MRVLCSEMEAAIICCWKLQKIMNRCTFIIAGDQNREESLTKDEYLEFIIATKNILEASRYSYLVSIRTLSPFLSDGVSSLF